MHLYHILIRIRFKCVTYGRFIINIIKQRVSNTTPFESIISKYVIRCLCMNELLLALQIKNSYLLLAMLTFE
jgi:hypothetical protein